MTGTTIVLQTAVILLFIALSILVTAIYWRRTLKKHRYSSQTKMDMMRMGLDVQMKDIQDKARVEQLKSRLTIDKALKTAKDRADFMHDVLQEIQKIQEGFDSSLHLLVNAGVVPGRQEWTLICNLMQEKSSILSQLVNGCLEVMCYDRLEEVDKTDEVIVNEFCQLVFDGCITELHDGVETNLETCLPDDYVIRTNLECLTKVLRYLLLNSMIFTNRGSITIGVSEPSQRNVLTFTVRDTGSGIPEEVRPVMFNQLQNDEAVQMILGMRFLLCRKLVKLLGGNIFLDSSDKNGTTIVFSIRV